MDCATAILANQAMNFFATGVRTGPHRQRAPNIVPYQVFPVEDGDDHHRHGQRRAVPPSSATSLNRADLAAHPDYATNGDRVQRREALVPLLTAETRKWKRDALLDALRHVKVPAGPINTIAQAIENEQVMARGMHIRPEGVDGLRSPFRFSESDLATSRSAPMLGQDDDDVRANGFG
jgi:crotonobetainyl-CoA:carnitine CoA-transferase CaiB-like acyl-CoA transferase